MKIVMISDTHFGDEDSTLVQQNNGIILPGPRYQQFKEAAGADNDYLVLAGDIFDFSVASYEKAYLYAQGFFQQIQKDKIAKRFLYLSGNHDADMWFMLQHQRSVIKQLEQHKLPQSYEHSIPAILDDRTGSPLRNIVLNKVERQKGEEPYGGMFLDDITDPRSTFYFAFPNFYIITDTESVLVTHGQYLEWYWSLLGETIPEIAREDIPTGQIDIEEMVEMNFPLNQLACTGIGQAGIVTPLARKIEKDAANKKLDGINIYLDRLIGIIDERWKLKCQKKWIVKLVLKALKAGFLKDLADKTQTRFSKKFLCNADVQNRFSKFYRECLREIDGINKRTGANLPAPVKIIFGHTHQPIAWNNPLVPPDSIFHRSMKLYNMGGWLETSGVFCGAEVFVYETGTGFKSIPIK